MTISQVERRIRAGLPFIRFMQKCMPLPMANKLIKLGAARVKLDAGLIQVTGIADGVPCERLRVSVCPR